MQNKKNCVEKEKRRGKRKKEKRKKGKLSIFVDIGWGEG